MDTRAFGLVFVGVGIGCGGGSGDGPGLPTTAVPTVTAIELLSREKADAVLSKAISAPAMCAWRGLVKHTDTTWAFMASTDATRACGEALQTAGIARLGKCLDDNPREKCFKREISATGNADSRMVEKTSELGFACGKVEYKRLVSVTTKDQRTAVARFSRLVTIDSALMKSIETCVIAKPEPGELERERTFQRDDAGNWTLLPLP